MLPLTVAPRQVFTTFMNVPFVADLDRLDAHFAVIGMPYGGPYSMDEVTNDQTNAPTAVRRATQRLSPFDHWDFDVGGTAIVAWDGKEPSSRAARRAVALLKKASKIVIVGSPSGDAPADLNRLAGYYAAHGLEASVEIFPKGDILQQLIEANARHGADYMVAGAFGRSRLREFAFGGTTRALLQTTQLNLYMAH